MIEHHPIADAVWLVAFCAGGCTFGWGYFAALLRWVEHGRVRERSVWSAASIFARLAAATLFFTLIAREGTAALLSAFAGFLLARAWALRGARGGR